MSETVQRKLAAILAADVVGYTRLMEADEAVTLAMMKVHRQDLWAPWIGRHNGRVVGTAGDSILVEFASAVAAVECAIGVQQDLAVQNAEVSGDRRMQLRIGVNLGEVIVDGDTIHGDGVNLAARLEGLCEPGGVALSASVHDQVRGKLSAAFEDSGEHAVKNVARPVRVWRWIGSSAAASPQSADSPEPPSLSDKPSIAVLPFDNMSGDPEQGYFADGIAEDIITDLSKISGLMVIARNSSFSYKGHRPDIRQVCRDLGVRYVLEGSVRKAGGRVRINAQLIEGASGGHIWAERFDRDLEDIFAVQDEVTREIVAALRVALTPGEQRRREGRSKVDPEAYDLLVRARTVSYGFTADASQEARGMLERAIAIDPELAPAYAMLSLLHSLEHVNGWNGAGPGHLDRALDFARQALAVDADDPQAYHALALAQMWRGELDEAELAAERAIALDPNYAGALAALGSIRDYAGRHEGAIGPLRQALRLDPQYHVALQFLGRAQFMLGRYADAEATFRARLVQTPRSDTTRAFLASLYGLTGQIEAARRIWAELTNINPTFSVEHLLQVLPYNSQAFEERFLSGLRSAGLAQ